LVVALSVYGILRVQDLARRGMLSALRRPDYESGMFLLEIGLGVLLPIVLLAIPRVRVTQSGLVTGAILVVLGFVMHRLNVSVTGMERVAGVRYLPSWMEIAVSLALMAAGFAIFGWAVRYLPIFDEVTHPPRTMAVPAWLAPKGTPTFLDRIGSAVGQSTVHGGPE